MWEPVSAVDNESAFCHVDAGSIASNIDDVVRIGLSFDVVIRVRIRSGSGEVNTEIAEPFIECCHDRFVLIEFQSVCCSEVAEELDSVKYVLLARRTYDDVVCESRVPIPRIAYVMVESCEGEVGE